MDMDTDSSKTRNGGKDVEGVAAVNRALAILEAFDQPEPTLSLTDIARSTGLYKSTVLRLLGSLERANLVTRRGDGEYILGPMIARLGVVYRRSFKLDSVVMPILQGLMTSTNESASFYVRSGNHRMCLFRVDSEQYIRDFSYPGDLLPLDRGAAGRVLSQFQGGIKAEPFSPQEIVILSVGEYRPGGAALAAPVFGAQGELVGALGVSGPEARFTKQRIKKFSASLLDAAKAATAALGGKPAWYPKNCEPRSMR